MGAKQQKTDQSGAFSEALRRNSRRASDFVDISLQSDGFYVRVGHKVRQFREQKGLTQEDLARGVPMDRGYLSDVETGKRRVSLYLAYQIAQALEQTLDDLLAGETGDA